MLHFQFVYSIMQDNGALSINFDLSEEIQNIHKLMEIELFGYVDTFSYKAMALSSYSKVVFFFGVQLYRHIKRPNRLNTFYT